MTSHSQPAMRAAPKALRLSGPREHVGSVREFSMLPYVEVKTDTSNSPVLDQGRYTASVCFHETGQYNLSLPRKQYSLTGLWWKHCSNRSFGEVTTISDWFHVTDPEKSEVRA